MRRLSVALALLCWLLPGVLLARGAGAPNVLIAADRTEPVVTVDQHHPGTVVVGSNPNYDAPSISTFPTGYFVSRNGGKSFARGDVPLTPPFTTGADPTIIFGASGTLFYSYLGETDSYCSASGRSAVLVTTSTDHGGSFRRPTVIDVAGANDKPNMALENIAGHRAHVFVTWTRFHATSSDLWVARSDSGGDSFSRPLRLYSSKDGNSGSVPVVGPGGRVYVFWASDPDAPLERVNRARIMVSVSKDDGQSFSRPRVVARFWALPRELQPGSLRNLTMPAAVLSSDGSLFVSWPQVTHSYGGGRVSADIVITRSSNGGKSWSPLQRLNAVRRGDRFMPALVLLHDGSMAAAFYDRMRGPEDLGMYATRFTWGTTFHRGRSVRLTGTSAPVGTILLITPDSTCFSPGRFFGDYIGMAAYGNTAYVAWADSQRRIPNRTDIWLSRVVLPKP